jgi:hypothetical protein
MLLHCFRLFVERKPEEMMPDIGDNWAMAFLFAISLADKQYPNRNLTRTLDYLETFSRFKDEENIKAVERLLNSHTELEMFERSQLGMVL